MHVLNAISPAFTASFSLADLIIEESYQLSKVNNENLTIKAITCSRLWNKVGINNKRYTKMFSRDRRKTFKTWIKNLLNWCAYNIN